MVLVGAWGAAKYTQETERDGSSCWLRSWDAAGDSVAITTWDEIIFSPDSNVTSVPSIFSTEWLRRIFSFPIFSAS